MLGRIGVALVPVLLVAAWLVQLSRRAPRPPELDRSRPEPGLADYRKAVGWRWAGLGLGVGAAALASSAGSLGLGMMLAPTVLGLCLMSGVVVGELTTIPRREGVRTAVIETRTVGDYLPRRLGGLVAASTLGLGALLTTTTRMGSADDVGRVGRSLSRQCAPGLSASNGPWPGLFYSVPLGIVVVVGLVGAAVALRALVLRPRSVSDPELVVADDVLRRGSAEAVVAAAGVMVSASLLAVALTAGSALIGFACAPTSWTLFGVALLAVGGIMLLLFVWCLALLLSGLRIRAMLSGDTAVDGQKGRR